MNGKRREIQRGSLVSVETRKQEKRTMKAADPKPKRREIKSQIIK